MHLFIFVFTVGTSLSDVVSLKLRNLEELVEHWHIIYCWIGAEYPPFQLIPTEYDFDAPVTEAGDITLKYIAIRDLIGKVCAPIYGISIKKYVQNMIRILKFMLINVNIWFI